MKHGWSGFWLRMLAWGVVAFTLSRTAAADDKPSGKSIGFSNLVFRPRGGDRVGIADENFKLQILEHLRRRGLNAVGGEDLVFGTDRESRAQLLLGGTVTELDCVSAVATLVTCRMAIEWQVLDVSTEQVIYKVTSWGKAVDAPKEPASVVGQRLLVSNLDSLTGRVGFQELLKLEVATSAAAQGYTKANLRGCQVAPRSMPGASEQVLDATAFVQTSGGFGSGFIVSNDGFVATAAHVVPESTATVKLRDGREFPATVVRIDRRLDIALLRMAVPEGTNLPCLPTKLTPLPVGADVYAVGSPARKELSFSIARGIVSGIRLLDGLSYLQTDTAISPGNSGGPLVTTSGEAAAIVSFKLVGTAVEGVAFGVPLAPALNAIGVTLGQGFTSPLLATAGAAPARAPQLLRDRDDSPPAIETAPAGPRSTSVQGVGHRRSDPAFKRILYGWGAGLLITGVGFVVVGTSLDDSYPAWKERNDKLTRFGWVTTAAGGVLLGIGIALP